MKFNLLMISLLIGSSQLSNASYHNPTIDYDSKHAAEDSMNDCSLYKPCHTCVPVNVSVSKPMAIVTEQELLNTEKFINDSLKAYQLQLLTQRAQQFMQAKKAQQQLLLAQQAQQHAQTAAAAPHELRPQHFQQTPHQNINQASPQLHAHYTTNPAPNVAQSPKKRPAQIKRNTSMPVLSLQHWAGDGGAPCPSTPMPQPLLQRQLTNGFKLPAPTLHIHIADSRTAPLLVIREEAPSDQALMAAKWAAQERKKRILQSLIS